MKISFGPNDYVEMIGSGENGELTEKEFELFNSSVNKFFDERKEKLEQDRLKLEQDRIKLEQETNKITQKNLFCIIRHFKQIPNYPHSFLFSHIGNNP